MKLIDQIMRRPVRIGFGQRGSGNAGVTIDIRRDGDSVDVAPGQTLEAATGLLAGVMTAADRLKLDGLVNAAGAVEMASLAEAEATTIEPGVAYLRTTGRVAAGDGGGGLWVRAAGEPAHAGKLRSADGAWWELVRDGRNNNLQFGAFGGVESTSHFQDFLDFVAGATGRIVADPGGADYLTNTLVLREKTVLHIDAVTIHCISGGHRILQIQEPDIHVIGHGATLRADGTQMSHPLIILQGARHCSVSGLKIVGAGNTGDDCVYIGGNPAANDIPEYITLRNLEIDGNARARNCISIVAGRFILIEDVEVSNPLAAPGLGIDVEANRYMADGTSAVRAITLRRIRAHDCPTNAGIGVIFGSEVTIEDCDIWNCHKAIIAGAGGAQFNTGVWRPGDRLGIAAFDTVDGWLTVTSGTAGTDLLTDDLGVEVGMCVGRRTTPGAVWPSEFANAYYVIAAIDSTQSRVRLGTCLDVGLVVASDQGTGTLDLDPEVADFGLVVFGRTGNSDLLRVINTRTWANDAGGALFEIDMGTSRNVHVENCTVTAGAFGMTFPYSTGVTLIGNEVRRVPGGTSGRGVMLSGGCGHRTEGNTVRGFPFEGIYISGGSRSRFGADRVFNCGQTGNIPYRVFSTDSAIFSPIIATDDAHPTSQGFFFDAGCTNCIASGVIAKGVGSSNGTSLTGGTGTVWRDCIQMDGSLKA